MPAHEEAFPWPSYYKHFKFFEQQMNSHGRVKDIESLKNGRYDITRDNGEIIKVFICECYSFGVAEYIESTDNLGNLDAIIINSMWCGYTPEAKRYCRNLRVGLFKIAGFMAALNKPNFWMYLDEHEKQYFKENGWL